MQLQPTYITGMASGLTKNKKPFLLTDQAWSTLENAYVWRERLINREGNQFISRLKRGFTNSALGNADGAGAFTGNIISILGLEATAEIKKGSITITAGANSLTEPATPNGTLTGVPAGTGTINYVTGALTLAGVGAGAAITITFSYYPSLPVMGIWQREQAALNDEQTIIFDTTYAYAWDGSDFGEYITGTTWAGTDADFFYCSNYRGSTPQSRLFFVTNFVCNASNPMRYTDGTTWTSFAPLVSATDTLFQARILIPYYGRLVALNVFEGTTAGGYGTASQIGNRCRFSAIGDPTAVDAWRSDIFGKGGFIDAPVSEQITAATFYKNTLIVGFERSTWQLRYVGEYGIPFLWERISTDFGTESTFSSIIFDDGTMSVGDKAIISSTGVNVQRIDLEIPDQAFLISNVESGPVRVNGVRNFQKELVYWSFPDGELAEQGAYTKKFPNRVLLYNYRNNTWAIFRDNVTFFGTFQVPTEEFITWNSTDITWDDTDVFWSDDPDSLKFFPKIISGNQQGFIESYATSETANEESLTITAVTLSTGPNLVTLTVNNHNLETGEIIFIEGMLFFTTGAPPIPTSTNLNNAIYMVTVVDANTITLSLWDSVGKIWYSDIDYTPTGTVTYMGGGVIALLTRMNAVTKDFNPYTPNGMQMMLSYIDFQVDVTASSAFTVELFANSYLGARANLNENDQLVANQQSPTSVNNPYYITSSQYAWHRFFATLYGQYIRIGLTWDDELMNDLDTFEEGFELNAICIWSKPGGLNPF